jgi:hypothetical protein
MTAHLLFMNVLGNLNDEDGLANMFVQVNGCAGYLCLCFLLPGTVSTYAANVTLQLFGNWELKTGPPLQPRGNNSDRKSAAQRTGLYLEEEPSLAVLSPGVPVTRSTPTDYIHSLGFRSQDSSISFRGLSFF